MMKGVLIDLNKVKRIDRELVYTGSVVDIYQDTMKLHNDEVQKWDFVHRHVSAVAIVPITKSGNLILVKQFRPALNSTTYEIPAGAVDRLDSDIKSAALRELREETGYSSDDVGFLMKVNPISAYCDEVIDIFVAKDVKKVSEQELDVGESIEIVELGINHVVELIYDGYITDGKTVAGVLGYHCKYCKCL